MLLRATTISTKLSKVLTKKKLQLLQKNSKRKKGKAKHEYI